MIGAERKRSAEGRLNEPRFYKDFTSGTPETAILKQRHLRAGFLLRHGRAEAAAVELRRPAARAVAVQAEAAAGDLEALLDQLGEVAHAGHARAEARIVVPAAAKL